MQFPDLRQWQDQDSNVGQNAGHGDGEEACLLIDTSSWCPWSPHFLARIALPLWEANEKEIPDGWDAPEDKGS